MLSTTRASSSSLSFLVPLQAHSSADSETIRSFSLRLSDSTLSNQTFAQLYGQQLPQWLLDKCASCGWTHPTHIQEAALNALLLLDNNNEEEVESDGDMQQQRDVMVQAETGSGSAYLEASSSRNEVTKARGHRTLLSHMWLLLRLASFCLLSSLFSLCVSETLAYLLPALANIDASRSAVQALIVVPTRELGLQVGRVAKRLAAGCGEHKLLVMNVLQGSRNRRQRAWAWAEPPHLVVGTPRELCDMVRHGGLKRTNSIRTVVVDEVDACLRSGSSGGGSASPGSNTPLHELLSKYLSPTYLDSDDDRHDNNNPLASLTSASTTSTRPVSRHRRTIFASATLPQRRHFVKQCVQNQWTLSDKEPVHICLHKGQEQTMPSTLHHTYLVCRSPSQKLGALRRMVQKWHDSSNHSNSKKKLLVFCEPQRNVEHMAEVLCRDLCGDDDNGDADTALVWNESCDAGDLQGKSAVVSVLRFEDSLSQRAAAMNVFRGEEKDDDMAAAADTNVPGLRVLLAAGDLSARGVDIEDITHVIHFDLPCDADTYVHRAGRTGRFQRSGTVVSIITPEQEFVLQRMANKLISDAFRCIGRQQPSKQRP